MDVETKILELRDSVRGEADEQIREIRQAADRDVEKLNEAVRNMRGHKKPGRRPRNGRAPA